jgi:TatD DNase family protein
MFSTPTAWTDAHCHLQDGVLTPDLPALLERSATFGIQRWLVNGTHPGDWKDVANLARRFPGIRPQFGIHPWHAADATDSWEPQLKGLLLEFPQAGIGEIGLDQQLTDTPIELQRKVFNAQLRIAVQLNRPCTFHLVSAWPELDACLKETCPPRFLLHSFSGSAEQVRGYAQKNAWFSFGGAVIRQSNSKKLHAAIQAVPRDRLLLETDAPFQHPDGKQARQEPAGLLRIAEAVANIRKIPVDILRQQTEENVATFLGSFEERC